MSSKIGVRSRHRDAARHKVWITGVPPGYSRCRLVQARTGGHAWIEPSAPRVGCAGFTDSAWNFILLAYAMPDGRHSMRGTLDVSQEGVAP